MTAISGTGSRSKKLVLAAMILAVAGTSDILDLDEGFQ